MHQGWHAAMHRPNVHCTQAPLPLALHMSHDRRNRFLSTAARVSTVLLMLTGEATWYTSGIQFEQILCTHVALSVILYAPPLFVHRSQVIVLGFWSASHTSQNLLGVEWGGVGRKIMRLRSLTGEGVVL